MRRVIFALVMVVGMLSGVLGEDFTFDTRIGMYRISNQSKVYRNTRLAYKAGTLLSGIDFLKPLSVRIEHEVIGKVGLTGDSDTYRISGHALYKIDLDKDFYVMPSSGVGLSGSNVDPRVLSVDTGLDICYSLSDIFYIPVSGQAIFFSDAVVIYYQGGLGVKPMNWLSIDGLYTATLSNCIHNIGFAGRLNLYF